MQPGGLEVPTTSWSASEVGRRIASRLAAGEAGATPTVSVEPVSATNNSRTFRLTAPDLDRDLLVKATDPDKAAEEYRALEYVAARFGPGRYRVPQPVTLLADEGLLCMTWVDGRLARDVLEARSAPDARQAAIVAAGAWLAYFHALERGAERPLDVAGKLALVDAHLAMLDENARHSSVAGRARAWLAANAGEVGLIPVTHGLVHGDYKPENLLLAETATTGIDFTAARDGAQIMDVAQFANHLLLERVRPRGFRAWGKARQWADQFTSAYIDAGAAAPSLPLLWLRVTHLLRFWSLDEARGGVKGTLQARLIGREIDGLLAADPG